jgi:hypothetical protein
MMNSDREISWKLPLGRPGKGAKTVIWISSETVCKNEMWRKPAKDLVQQRY